MLNNYALNNVEDMYITIQKYRFNKLYLMWYQNYNNCYRNSYLINTNNQYDIELCRIGRGISS